MCNPEYAFLFDDLSFGSLSFAELNLFNMTNLIPRRNRLDSHGSDIISDSDDGDDGGDDRGFDDEGERGFFINNRDVQHSDSPPIPNEVNWGWDTDDDEVDGVIRNDVVLFSVETGNDNDNGNDANNFFSNELVGINDGVIIPADLADIPIDALLSNDEAYWIFNQFDPMDIDEWYEILHEVIAAEMESDHVDTITISDDDDENDEGPVPAPNVECDVIIISDDEE